MNIQPVADVAKSSGAFFRQQIRSIPPINADYWSFVLRGLVDLPLFLSYSDLLAMPSIERACTIACAGSSRDKSLIGTATWHGVSFQTILNEVAIEPGTRHAHFFSADGYSTSLPLDKLQDALLVYGMNGEKLPPEHGFPVRLIVPGLYGYKMPKWIQRVELNNEPIAGTWEQRGLSLSGEVQTTAAITSHVNGESISGTVTLAGIAYAGTRAITQVGISIDDSPWMPAPFACESHACSAHWSITWTPSFPGDYSVKVRASDPAGFTQSDAEIHAIVVRVTA